MLNDQNVPDYLHLCSIQAADVNYSSDGLYNQESCHKIKKQPLQDAQTNVNKSNKQFKEASNETKQYCEPIDAPLQTEDKTKLISSSQANSIIHKDNLEEDSDFKDKNKIKHDDHDYDLRNKNTMKRGYCEDNESQYLNSGTKRCKPTIVTDREMRYFFNLLEKDNIQDFLDRDRCCLISDKVN